MTSIRSAVSSVLVAGIVGANADWLSDVRHPAAAAAPAASGVGRTVNVSSARALADALARATPGTTIVLRDGTYRGRFTLKRSGTAGAPIRITGTRSAKLDGGSTSSGYVLHLDGASYVRVEGISVGRGQKAVVLDESHHITLTDMAISRSGAELVLIRNFSRDNVVSNNDISYAGLVKPGYGEGVYIGLAKSNWSSSQSRTRGAPDTSDRNRIVGNRIRYTTAESIDIKEGTTGGVIANNRMNAAGMSGANHADSWIDVKGNAYVIRRNVGTNPGGALVDGFQAHVALDGWGRENVFTGNVAKVNARGYGFYLHKPGLGNVVSGTNVVSGAARGIANVPLSR